MRGLLIATAGLLLTGLVSTASAAEISGQYLEARTCDVYTGPCFANAEMGITGKEAVLAWKVDEGSWKGVALDGLGVALVLNSENTLGNDGVFPMKAGKITSVILVDEKADERQHDALVSFVRSTASELTQDVREVQPVPIELTNDHLDGRGVFQGGDVARIETRALEESDCICTNEVVFYQPLTEVENSCPAYSKDFSYQGESLDKRWSTNQLRSAFLATFRR